MLSDDDRKELERIIAADPFAGVLPEVVNALRADELMGTLFLHRQKPGGSGCVCGTMRFGEYYPLHLAGMIRRTMDVTSKAAESEPRN